ncbi:MAG: bifunctional methylenetetrahydrofolate dehydrogenase/methenyltetrahydrofolate cyclohydrolase [Leptospiraceae bacterium]|nr:bifunctional methylenetetrahydrofolate dehydrogenase/methenyltetrahydrofolate cyclohydrolase [Leptospiraceae bacterium]MCP5497483.1 bifunctional methylenetetrahydrofolate dehydrogenase/methenyltetrahydrofolate cyclohydrolase [Leptospiraceae bacterium]
MDSIVLDGKQLAEKIKSKITKEIIEREKAGLSVPTLATILVGNDPASATYVNMKIKACKSVGMGSKYVHLDEKTTTNELLDEIDKLNRNEEVSGILLQHPCPQSIDERMAFDRIAYYKDVDGVNLKSFGRLSMKMDTFFPCTPYGIMLLLKEYKISLSGKNAVVVGRSPILGKPMSMILLNEDCTVTICHSKTQNLPEIVKNGDIIIGALGKPEFIKADWIKTGAILIDAGYNQGNVGDIEMTKAMSKSSYYTPVPGGVGPMTIAVLLQQTLQACKLQRTK